MTKRDEYRKQLSHMDNWIPYLLEHSNLPGPRANLELAHAAADEGTPEQFAIFLSYTPDRAPVNSPEEFVSVCGAIGLGRLVAEGQSKYLKTLKTLANDLRWRTREGVAMGLQRVGERKMSLLLTEMEKWSHGSWLVQRAAAAGLCEPALLRDPETVQQVLAILDAITRNIADADAKTRKDEAFVSLRQSMGYCWSVAIVADPPAGKEAFEAWLGCADPDVRWILKENLKKKRLERMDAKWVSRLLRKLNSTLR